MSKQKPLGSELYTHRDYIFEPRPVSLTSVGFGDVISFSYDGQQRHVFVLNENWEDKLHCLDLTHINRDKLVQEIIPVMDGTDDPMVFYNAYLDKSMITLLDCYRIFFLNKMSRVVRYRYEINRPIETDKPSQVQVDASIVPIAERNVKSNTPLRDARLAREAAKKKKKIKRGKGPL